MEPHVQAARCTACKEAQGAQASRSMAYMEFQVPVALWRHRSLQLHRGGPVTARRIYLHW